MKRRRSTMNFNMYPSGDIEAQSKEMKDIEKHINELRNYITRLNMKLGKEKDGKKDQVLEIKQMDAQLKVMMLLCQLNEFEIIF